MTSSTPPASSLNAPPCFVGIDVGKASLDMATTLKPESRRFDNSAAGIQALVEALTRLMPKRIVVEASGGYEEPLVIACLQSSLPVYRVQPQQARHFAMSMNLRAKTDTIDACMLAEFASKLPERALPAAGKSPRQQELDALVLRRGQLVDTRAQESCRLESAPAGFVRKNIESSIRQLGAQIKKIDHKIGKLIDSDDDLSGKHQILTSASGVGAATSAALLSQTPELGTLDRKQISALVGVAPHPDDSGTRTGKRSISGGRRSIRCALYMATLSARSHNPQIKAFAQRLTAAGKPFKVMMIACMRKLLTILNAMVRDGTTFKPAQASVTA